jgi:hypothetical protein
VKENVVRLNVEEIVERAGVVTNPMMVVNAGQAEVVLRELVMELQGKTLRKW